MRRLHLIVAVSAPCILAAAAARGAGLEELGVHGFMDVRGGVRTQSDPVEDSESLAEARLQLETQQYAGDATLALRADLLADALADDRDVDLETGDGWFDLREANLLLSPAQWMDLKAGRQILTWGTGDLLFINDLFPKDWRSFFLGRDEEYLKAPSDAVLVSMFPSWFSIDVAYTPRFDPDRFLTGERVSFYNSALGRRSGQDAVVDADTPDDWFDDQEIAVRLSRYVAGAEVALYGYRGYWKSPAGQDPASGRAVFPELSVAGASWRGQAGPGILNAELGYYHSGDDSNGKDPLVRNSESRALLGYQRELARDLSATLQYYLELMQDHDAYLDGLPEGAAAADEDRHLLTLRLTQQLMNQNLTLSLFSYYSPSDQDAYLRPAVSYKASDQWLLTAGGNLFAGEEEYTFFGQLENNSNLYMGARYSF